MRYNCIAFRILTPLFPACAYNILLRRISLRANCVTPSLLMIVRDFNYNATPKPIGAIKNESDIYRIMLNEVDFRATHQWSRESLETNMGELGFGSPRPLPDAILQ